MAKLELSDITVAYETFTLSNVSFSCSGGEILALIGRNGAGKTTTIDSIMGLTTLQSGSVCYNGQLVTKVNEHQFKQKIGYVGASQEYYMKNANCDRACSLPKVIMSEENWSFYAWRRLQSKI